MFYAYFKCFLYNFVLFITSKLSNIKYCQSKGTALMSVTVDQGLWINIKLFKTKTRYGGSKQFALFLHVRNKVIFCLKLLSKHKT